MKRKYLSLLAIPLITLPISASIISCSNAKKDTNREETNPTIDTIEDKNSELDEKILNVYPIGNREQTDSTFTTKENQEKIELLLEDKNQTNNYEDIKKIWLCIQEIHNSKGEKIISELLSKEEFDIFEMKNIKYTKKENGFSLSFSMNFSLEKEELAKEYKFSYSNVNISEEGSTISEDYVLSNLMKDVEIINFDNNDYLTLLEANKLNKSLSELKEEYRNEPRKLLEILSKTLSYKNLSDLVSKRADLSMDIDSIKITNWKIENNIVVDLNKDLENLLTNFEKQGQENENKLLLSFQLKLPLSKNIDTKTIRFALNINIDEETSKKEINSIKDSLTENIEQAVVTQDNLKNLNYRILIKDFDETIKKINNSSSITILTELFKAKEISSKYSVSHKLYKINSGQEKKIESIPLRTEEFNADGYRIDFVLEQEGLQEKIISVNIDTEKYENKFSIEDNAKILFNRIDNLNNQLLGNDLKEINSIKQRIEALTIEQKEIKEQNKSNYKNNDEYIKITKELENKENSRKAILYKNRLLVSSQAFKTFKAAQASTDKTKAISYLKYILSDVNSQEIKDIVVSNRDELYKERYNTYKGLINSDPSKNFDFMLIDNSVIEKMNSQPQEQDKIYYKIEYSPTKENEGISVVSDGYGFRPFYYVKDLQSIIKITFKYKEQYKEFEFAIINPSIKNENEHQAQYEILSDALRNTDKQKVSYDIETNALIVSSSKEKFKKFMEASNELLNEIIKDPTKKVNSNRLIDSLNSALGHPTSDISNGIKYMSEYSNDIQLYGHNWFQLVNDSIILVNELMKPEDFKIEDYLPITVFAGTKPSSTRFAFNIKWIL